MKPFLLIALFAASFVRTVAQETGRNLGSFVGVPVGISMNELINPNWKAQSIVAGVSWTNFNGIIGNAFYKEDWSKGYILLRDNKIARDVFLRFNVYTNEIYFLLDSQVLVMDPFIPVAEFGMYDEKEESNKITIFRCGFPAINNNTNKTFYHVIVSGKISLLKRYNKSVMEATNSTGAFERKFTNSESLYVYNTLDNSIIAIKKNKNSLQDALPQYAHIIENIIKEKNLKVKTEKEWFILVNELNDQIE